MHDFVKGESDLCFLCLEGAESHFGHQKNELIGFEDYDHDFDEENIVN
jgi:hypothetical protein